MKDIERDLFTERAAKALEGIEMLLAMWIEKSVPGAELWVSESPDKELSRRDWRTLETPASRSLEKRAEPSGTDHRLEHIEDRLSRLASDLASLEARVHEELPE